nr:hypothetical protein [uncultured Devosia sp.]
MAALTLLLLSPFVGEFVLGNSPATELYLLPVLVPLYGAGALLVRELGRRAGGWPSIALLALAYSLLQPALIEMSLFNPRFGGVDFSALFLPGFSPHYALVFVGGHFIWSICLPILLVELICRRDVATAPWLGRLGLVGVAILFVLGLALYLDEFQTTQHFVAPWPHLAVSALAVVALIALALRWPSIRVASGDGWVPNPLAIGLGALVLSSAFFAAPEDWSGVALKLAALAIAAFCILRWTRSVRWTRLHGSALAAGTMLTYVWGSFILISLMGRTTAFDFAAQIGVAILAIAVCAIAISRPLRPA